MKSYIKKHFQVLLYVVSALIMAIAVVLNIVARKIYFDIEPIQLGEVTGMPYNVGFNWPSLMMMISILLFAMGLFTMLRCKSSFQIEIVQLIILLLCCVGTIDYVYSASELKMAFLFHDSNQLSFADLRVWSNVWTYIVWAIYTLSVIMVIKLLYVAFDKGFSKEKSKGRLIFSVITTVLLMIVLLARGFSDTWFLVGSAMLIVVSIVIMRIMKNMWNRHNLDRFCSDKSFWDCVVKDDTTDEEMEALERLYQEKDIINCDRILTIIKDLEEAGYNDSDIKGAVVTVVERRKNKILSELAEKRGD